MATGGMGWEAAIDTLHSRVRRVAGAPRLLALASLRSEAGQNSSAATTYRRFRPGAGGRDLVDHARTHAAEERSKLVGFMPVTSAMHSLAARSASAFVSASPRPTGVMPSRANAIHIQRGRLR